MDGNEILVFLEKFLVYVWKAEAVHLLSLRKVKLIQMEWDLSKGPKYKPSSMKIQNAWMRRKFLCRKTMCWGWIETLYVQSKQVAYLILKLNYVWATSSVFSGLNDGICSIENASLEASLSTKTPPLPPPFWSFFSLIMKAQIPHNIPSLLFDVGVYC